MGHAETDLGTALQTLGARESGPERLEQNCVGLPWRPYRKQASEKLTRERTPQWAGTQNNLGNALAILGARESGPKRNWNRPWRPTAQRLRNTPANASRSKWAATHNNLGNALLALGEREHDTKRLKQAIKAYRTALEEYTKRACTARLGRDAAQPRQRPVWRDGWEAFGKTITIDLGAIDCGEEHLLARSWAGRSA